MKHKLLTQRKNKANRRARMLCHQLHHLTLKVKLTAEDANQLKKLRLIANRAIQSAVRLNRRFAKKTGAEHIPSLNRSSFKKATTFKRIEKRDGTQAALEHLLALSDTLSK